jgi:hypothetical protein
MDSAIPADVYIYMAVSPDHPSSSTVPMHAYMALSPVRLIFFPPLLLIDLDKLANREPAGMENALVDCFNDAETGPPEHFCSSIDLTD